MTTDPASICPIHDEPMIDLPTKDGTVYICEWCHTGLDPKTFVPRSDPDDFEEWP